MSCFSIRPFPVEYDPNGIPVREIRLDHSDDRIAYTIRAAAMLADNRGYVVLVRHPKNLTYSVGRMTGDGQLVALAPTKNRDGAEVRLADPVSIAVDPFEFTLVVDNEDGRVVLFDSGLNCVSDNVAGPMTSFPRARPTSVCWAGDELRRRRLLVGSEPGFIGVFDFVYTNVGGRTSVGEK